MAFKDILVHLDSLPQIRSRLAIACDLAGRYSAHLTGLCAIDDPALPVLCGGRTGFADAAWIQQMTARLYRIAHEEAAVTKEAFENRLRATGIEGEWQLVEGSAADVVAQMSPYVDIAIVGQSRPEEATLANGVVAATTILAAGRPVVVVPYAGAFHSIGRTVLVGWKPCREAARAINDALPLLCDAEVVKILSINPDNASDRSAVDLTRHLARHGVKAEAANTAAKDLSEGDVLLNAAADLGADLIVIGGYGHSRARELVFGGVTRSLLSQMTVPVLFSH
jgi:nucleotide-binding universal stress UspA family protein